ncbi:MAG: (Fe-S)-binding protein [Candidatus Promineifilaceae bacterium]
MKITDYELEVFTPPCEPGADRYSAAAHLSVNIADALPYLNARLDKADYLPSANALTWKKAGHLVAFHAEKVVISNVVDRKEAVDELKKMIDLVNNTWDRRDGITPNYQGRKRPSPMAVYTLLPHSNCGECGEATCMGFTFGLIQGSHTLEDCPELTAEQLAALEILF